MASTEPFMASTEPFMASTEGRKTPPYSTLFPSSQYWAQDMLPMIGRQPVIRCPQVLIGNLSLLHSTISPSTTVAIWSSCFFVKTCALRICSSFLYSCHLLALV
jgi:hypothetical protein